MLVSVCTYVAPQIVYVSHFSAGGAAQLKMDLVQNLVPLLTQCTDLSSEQVLSKSVCPVVLHGRYLRFFICFHQLSLQV